MANAKTTEVKLLSIPIFDLEKKLLDLYTKFGDDTLVAEDTINYVKSMDEESKSKLMLLVAYEMQELDKGMTVFRQFLELFDSEFTDETNLAYSQLAKSIAIQTAIPNGYDDMMKKAIDAVDSREFLTIVIENFKYAFEQLSYVTEDKFGSNVIMQCIYDFETDKVYGLLLQMLRPMYTGVRNSVDHPISLSEWDDKSMSHVVSNWFALMRSYRAPTNDLDVEALSRKYENPSQKDLEAYARYQAEIRAALEKEGLSQ